MFVGRRRPSDISDFDYRGEEEETEPIPRTPPPIHDSPAAHTIELADDDIFIVEQLDSLGRLGDQLDERLKLDPPGRRRTIPSALLLPPPLRSPDNSDSGNSQGSSPRSFPSPFGSPVLHPRARSASSTSSFVLTGESALLDLDGVDVTSVVHRDHKGYLSAGTFAGLVDELLRKSTNGTYYSPRCFHGSI